jgi:hypothetical protein
MTGIDEKGQIVPTKCFLSHKRALRKKSIEFITGPKQFAPGFFTSKKPVAIQALIPK